MTDACTGFLIAVSGRDYVRYSMVAAGEPSIASNPRADLFDPNDLGTSTLWLRTWRPSVQGHNVDKVKPGLSGFLRR